MFTRAALSTATLLLLFTKQAAAKTDLAGCVSSSTVVNGGASLIWYVPDSGEICAFLDCGGGMAPPKTTVPGCPLYSGTATYSPSYLPGLGSGGPTTTAGGDDATPTITSPAVLPSSSASDSDTETETDTDTEAQTVTDSNTGSDSASSTDSDSDSDSSSQSTSSSSSASPSTLNSSGASESAPSQSTGAAAAPTALLKGAFGVMAGLAAGVAML